MPNTHPSRPNKTAVQIGILVFTLLILPITLIAINKRTSQKINASTGNAALSIQPTQLHHDIHESSTLSVQINPNGEHVSSVDLYISYDPTIIQINSITPGNFFTDPQNQRLVAPPQVILNTFTNGQIHYVIGFPLDSNFSSNQIAYLANISYTTLASGTAPITIIASGNPSSIITNINAINVLDTNNITNGQIIINRPNS